MGERGSMSNAHKRLNIVIGMPLLSALCVFEKIYEKSALFV